MTTLARPQSVSAQSTPSRGGTGSEAFADRLLIRAFQDLPGALELSITDSRSGGVAYLVLDDLRREDEAYDRFVRARAEIGDFALDLICVDRTTAPSLLMSESARIYSLHCLHRRSPFRGAGAGFQT